MSQYKEEQLGEIFSLESIYPDELEILEEEPFHQFKLQVKSEGHDEEQEIGYSCSLKFTYTPTYPEEVPVIEIMDDVGLDDEQLERLKDRLDKEAEDTLGMVMIFSLVSAANEWLNNEWDSELKRREEEAERKILEAEEVEKNKFHGTPVTVENFLRWKAEFDAEITALKKPEREDKDKKLTGRELFMVDKSMIESDLKFLEEGGEVVRVDESLFQDLEDLGLDELLSDESDH
uniref:EOG090X0F6V n=1 Tax=Simocephalus serrulatus TaxID=117539 RepID=A0A4Y7NPZ3_9CRUS|nr:EOG090X0F6V [Simocephalus serrulatus]SVE94544.1 EOG090X0F6V [Simocephalus serrulatus]